MLKIGSGVKLVAEKPEKPKEDSKEDKAKAKSINVGGNTADILSTVAKVKGAQVFTTANKIPRVRRLPTSIFEFDFYTGGGFPRGRYSIVFGPESSNKTNVALKAVAQAQRLPGPCNVAIWVNLEGTFDPFWASLMGVDVDKLIVINPGYGEEAVDLIDALVRGDDVACLVVDSIAMLVSSKEIAQSVEVADVGASSLLIRRLCNKLVVAFAEQARKGLDPAVILVNQIRFKIGASKFENPEIVPGGKTQHFLSSLSVRVGATNKIIQSVNPNVHAYKETRAIIKKSKVPVISNNFQFDLTMIAHDHLNVGDTDSWSTVKKYLQQLDLLSKGKKGWDVAGKNYPTLDVIQDAYYADNEFRLLLQGLVIDAFVDSGSLVDEPVYTPEPQPGMMFQPGQKAVATTTGE